MAYIETRTLKTGITYRVRWRADGEQQTSPAFDTLKEAEDYKTLLDAEQITTGRARNLTRSQTPFETVAEDWYRLWAPSVDSEATRKNKRSVLDAQLIPEFGQRGIGEITRKDIQIWANESDAAPSSLRKHHDVLLMVMKHAFDEDLLPRGLPLGAGLVKIPKAGRRKIFLSHEELDHLLATTRTQHLVHYPLIHLEGHTGLRAAEILGLPRTAFHARRASLHVAGTKSDASYRTIALDGCCVDVVRQQLRGHEYGLIFPAPGGGLNNVSNWRKRVWYPIRKAAGFEDMGLHFHDLRHTHASHLLEAGWEVTAVAERLGHTPKVMLEVYSHVTSKDRQANLIALKGMRG